MSELFTKLPVKTGKGDRWPVPFGLPSLESLQRDIDRLFENFGGGSWSLPMRRTFGLEPLLRGDVSWGNVPAVDIVERDKAFEITAEIPGMEEKDVELKVSSGVLTIKGEKSEEKEEKEKDYYLSERRYGAFERSFRIPDEVDTDKIEATFKKGVLTVTMPKKPEAQKPEKKITVKAA
ncbi:MAG: Hsp20/alpha crystallin family protein [Bauldia sp.]